MNYTRGQMIYKAFVLCAMLAISAVGAGRGFAPDTSRAARHLFAEQR